MVDHLISNVHKRDRLMGLFVLGFPTPQVHVRRSPSKWLDPSHSCISLDRVKNYFAGQGFLWVSFGSDVLRLIGIARTVAEVEESISTRCRWQFFASLRIFSNTTSSAQISPKNSLLAPSWSPQLVFSGSSLRLGARDGHHGRPLRLHPPAGRGPGGRGQRQRLRGGAGHGARLEGERKGSAGEVSETPPCVCVCVCPLLLLFFRCQPHFWRATDGPYQLTRVCSKRAVPRGKSSFYRGLCTSTLAGGRVPPQNGVQHMFLLVFPLKEGKAAEKRGIPRRKIQTHIFRCLGDSNITFWIR